MDQSITKESTLEGSRTRPRAGWTLALVSAVLFMVTLDNLVVTTALPRIRVDLGASLGGLEWIVNAYTLTFAVLLMTGAALGDRFGRRRMLAIGLMIFTGASAAAAMAPSASALIVARAVQGAGGALVLPLTLTLLSEAFPAGRRGVALGIWSGVSGLGVAVGPVIGGAVVSGISWQWIFWLNVPVGLVVAPLALIRLTESRGPNRQLDLPGVALASGGLAGVVFALVRANALGWTSLPVLGAAIFGAVLLVAFVIWEQRTPTPMLPMRFFRSRTFAATNAVSLAMYFGMFGAIFLLAQFFQTAQGLSPLSAGLRTLPWTAMPIFVAPLAGLLSDRVGSRPLMFAGLTLQAVALAWLATELSPSLAYGRMIVPFMLAGAGMALVFAPAANAVLASVRDEEAGQASGATNAIREVGGVLGIAVLASVFSGAGGYATPHAFVSGLTPAVVVAAGVLAVGALAALAIPGMRRGSAPQAQPAGSIA
ncbi:MAG: DHA2 family efflux MFS transporter permease subunit [Solirubrobacterales bacterium]|nr:DHA2 family efflux MFS transporter permease subunit [Solirubrobacterales bacterium]MBV9917684.1 DHA2 family efflux MFS transporter permease subunit [Solirubrobacterales bacterium]